jgi:Zn-dependent protease
VTYSLAGVPLRISQAFVVLATLAGLNVYHQVQRSRLVGAYPPQPDDLTQLTAWWDQVEAIERAATHPSAAYALVAGFAAALAYALSIVAHELGHLYAARRLEVGVGAMQLHVAGGYLEIDDDERLTPRRHALIIAAGPLVTLALVLAGVFALMLTSDAPVTPAGVAVQQVLVFTTGLNALALAINLLPFPSLDGGQFLRAVWRLRPGVKRAP